MAADEFAQLIRDTIEPISPLLFQNTSVALANADLIVEPLNLHLLWDLINGQDIDEGFTLRIVHTTAPGKFGSRVPVDLNVDLNAEGGIWDGLQFNGDDDLPDFFPDEETGTGQSEAI